MPASTHPALEDGRELLAAIRRGDRPAFHSLMASYDSLVRGIVQAKFDPQLRSVLDPEDAVQEILITVYRKLPDLEFRGPAAFRGWLERIAASRMIDLRRRHFCGRRRGEGMCSLEDAAGHSPSGAEMRVVDGVRCAGPSPSSVAAGHEEQGGLGRILARIPTHQRRLIERAVIQRVPIADIAREEGAKLETVRKRLRRALDACRRVLPARTGTAAVGIQDT